MQEIALLVSSVLGLVALVCLILTLIKMFRSAGIVQGILGIITCGIWAFIWGWINADKENHKPVMLAWTACILINIVLSVVAPPTFPVAAPGGAEAPAVQ